MAGKHVTARVPRDVYDAIEMIRDEERTDRSTAIRRLLERGIEDWRLETATRRYQQGTVSIGRAAEIAAVSPWRLVHELDDRGIEVNYTEADLDADLVAAGSSNGCNDRVTDTS